MSKKHWIEDDAIHKKFWPYAKDDLGLSEDEVHDALGVASVKDFAGNMAAAKTLLQNYAAGIVPRRARAKLAVREPGHAEARTIAFCDLYAPDGTKIALTAREGVTHDELVRVALSLTGAAETLVNVFSFSAAPQKYTNNKRSAKSPARAPAGKPAPTRLAPPPAPGSGEHTPPPKPPAGNSNGGGTETFAVDSITAQVSPNGNRYYAVRGGRVKKHGGTAWPEIAEPQLETLTEYNPVNLEVGKLWDVSGFSICAVGEIPPGSTYPSKITAFAPST